MTSWKITGVFFIALLIALSVIKYQDTKIEALEAEKAVCLDSLDKANIQINSVNAANQANNKVVVKYNSMKKKEYIDENDSDLNALHTLDVMLEQQSVIE